MDAAGAWAALQPWITRLEIWRGYESDLETLLIYAFGIALYTVLVFAFCQNLSRVEAFHARPRAGWAGRTAKVVEIALVFPVMSMLFFGVLGASLFLLAKSQSTYQILLLAMAVVLSVRVTSFISSDMSVDLAKLLPLGLLGVFLVDPGSVTLAMAWARVKETPTLMPEIARFFALFIVAESALRGGRWAAHKGLAAYRGRRARRVEVKTPAATADLEIVAVEPRA